MNITKRIQRLGGILFPSSLKNGPAISTDGLAQKSSATLSDIPMDIYEQIAPIYQMDALKYLVLGYIQQGKIETAKAYIEKYANPGVKSPYVAVDYYEVAFALAAYYFHHHDKEMAQSYATMLRDEINKDRDSADYGAKRLFLARYYRMIGNLKLAKKVASTTKTRQDEYLMLPEVQKIALQELQESSIEQAVGCSRLFKNADVKIHLLVEIARNVNVQSDAVHLLQNAEVFASGLTAISTAKYKALAAIAKAYAFIGMINKARQLAGDDDTELSVYCTIEYAKSFDDPVNSKAILLEAVLQATDILHPPVWIQIAEAELFINRPDRADQYLFEAIDLLKKMDTSAEEDAYRKAHLYIQAARLFAQTKNKKGFECLLNTDAPRDQVLIEYLKFLYL